MSRIEIPLSGPWVVSVNEVFDVDYSSEENCLMWGETLFHAWRPIDGDKGRRRVIDVSNKDGAAFGVVVGLVESNTYTPVDGERCYSVEEMVESVRRFASKWESK